MKKYRFFDIGKNHEYFDAETNEKLCKDIAKNCYLPSNALVMKLLDAHPEFKVAFSISGTALEQFTEFAPEVLDSFKKLAAHENVEFLSETYHHSLSSLFSENEFKEQVELHAQAMQSLFNTTPTVFRNTELLYNNDLAKAAESMGYAGILSEGPDHVLGWKSPNVVYKPAGTEHIALLMKNYRLSDDIAFRFSDKSSENWPLTAEKFADMVASTTDGDTVNIFMDYETFGEHHDESSGIFKFFENLPAALLERDVSFALPSELAKTHLQQEAVEEMDVPETVSWADKERDASAWTGNKMQDHALSELYKLEEAVKASNDTNIIEDWRKLTSSDHFYYMCTKEMNDGAVHNYFSPYATPYDSFISYMNIMNDLVLRLKEKNINVEPIESPEAMKVEVHESPSSMLK
jgi:alpha-amylase